MLLTKEHHAEEGLIIILVRKSISRAPSIARNPILLQSRLTQRIMKNRSKVLVWIANRSGLFKTKRNQF